MKLEELREMPLPHTQVADDAWELARRRRRRTTVASAVVAAALVATTALSIQVVRDSGDPTEPSPAPAPSPTPTPTPTSTSTPGPGPSATPTITDLPDFAALALTVPTLAATDPVSLSDDPVDRAVLAIMPAWSSDQTTLTVVDVLGTDGRWRYVDVPGLVPTHDENGYQGPVLNPTSLSADGTQLALPQPDRVVVVDLTTGDYRSYDLPGPHIAVVWQDPGHLVVTEEGANKGRILDLADGSVTASSFTANTGFAPDGSSVTWGRSRELSSSDGTHVLAEVANYGGLQLTSPLVDDEVAVGLGGHDLKRGQTTYVGVAGVPIVDRHSGELRGFLYTEGPETSLLPTYLLGLDGDTVTLAAGVPPDYTRLLVLHWNWRTGEVTPVQAVHAGLVSGSLR
jgi:hypothetical protein